MSLNKWTFAFGHWCVCIFLISLLHIAFLWLHFLQLDLDILAWPCGPSVQFSRSIETDSLWPHELQQARPACLSPTHGVHPNPCSLSRWCHPTISSPSPPAANPSQHQGLFKWVSSSHQVAKVLEFQLQHQSFQWTPRTDLLSDGLVGSSCSPWDSQESSPTPQLC